MSDPARPPELTFRLETLANGLDVIVRRDPRLPTAAVNLWYHVGSKDEREGQRGFAHLFEHLMFEGSEHFPGDFFRPLQPLGARVNGSTSPDRTNYYIDLPSGHLELALAMESDRMGHLLPAIDEGKLRVQKGVVQNEYRQNYANRPYGRVPRLLNEALYGAQPQHPYRWPTIGLMEDVEAATLAAVESFYRRFYAPSNASLAIVGDLDEDRALRLAERYFGPISGGSPASRPPVPTLKASSKTTAVRLDDRVELDRLYLSWRTVPQFLEDDAPLGLAADILARGRSSRLFAGLVMGQELAQDVSAAHQARELAGTFAIVVTLRPGRSWERAREAIDRELVAMARDGPTPEELARARDGRRAQFLYALQENGGFGGVADRLNAYNVFLGDPGRIVTDFERFERVGPLDIAKAVARHLARGGAPAAGRVELLVSGRNEQAGDRPLDRSSPPKAASASDYRAPVPERRTLRCGAELWVIPRRDLPVVNATLAVPAGAGTHGSDRGGLASLTAGMLDEGTAGRSALDLAVAAESMATNLWSSSGWDGSYLGFRCLSPRLAESLDLAVDILRNPSFPEGEWRRLQGRTLAGLRARLDRAEARADAALLRALYPEGHPYGVPVDGEPASVEGLATDDLRAFHRRWYRPEGSAWIVAGDVDPDELAALFDDRLGDWSGRLEVPEGPPDPPSPQGRRIILEHRPGAVQAAVRVGQPGIRRGAEDYLDVLVLNQLFGGQFTARLNRVLREEKGMTYGVRSSFDARRGVGPMMVATSVQSDRAAEAVLDIAREFEGLRGDRPPTRKELEDARRGLREGRPRQFETPGDLVSRFAGLFVHGLPPGHHAEFPDRLAAVDRPRVLEAARRRLLPGGLVVVVVADADQVQGPLEALGWAEVERFDRTP